ncbi:MAG TPA: four helix bundle protein [Anaeromyxobacteraceae bacterium]|nr:four helix bundle protein [Anaeromyxobacteraceae bacterium]
MSDKPIYDTANAYLPHERLDAYRLALELHAAGTALMPKRGRAALRDQLERATMSIVLNIAEGAGRSTDADQRKFFDIAKGSATETAAILDILRGLDGARSDNCAAARALVIRVVQTLTRLSGDRR